MNTLLDNLPRYLFFTGKGGVGKTSMASATALALAEVGKKVLLISTDPASNLDEVLETPLSSRPTAIRGTRGLFALNIDPIQAAGEYRERMISPYRGVLPEAALQQMEEQLSGACTVEIAGFNEFSKVLSDQTVMQQYDHIILDTAPTGHTLRLLDLPSAWNDFIASNQTGGSCLGPIAGLKEQKVLFDQVVSALKDPHRTLLILVSRPEKMSFHEATRASLELGDLGLKNQHLVINGVFTSSSDDPIAVAFSEKSAKAIEHMPEELKSLPSTQVPFHPAGATGLAALKRVYQVCNNSLPPVSAAEVRTSLNQMLPKVSGWPALLQELEDSGGGVIMTMGKGGVGKTVVAAAIATELARRGHAVLLSTTDPAAHVTETVGGDTANLTVERIDPKKETKRYVADVLESNKERLSADDMDLLREEMRSPCIEEIAVFQAFAQTVAKGEQGFVVLDTAPTGHTLLLLDATQSYHREVEKSVAELPEAVKALLPRVRDPNFTRILLISLPEATPTHEAAALQEDLRRAGIEPYGWIINRCFALSGTKDPALSAKGVDELCYLNEIVERHAKRAALSPWIPQELLGVENLRLLHAFDQEAAGLGECIV